MPTNQNGKNAAPKATVSTEAPKIYAPIQGKPSEFSGSYGEPRSVPTPHIHAGVDIPCPTGTPCIAPVDGKITQWAVDHGFAPGEGPQEGGGMVQFEFLQDLGNIKKGDVIGWGHVFHVYVQPGQSVKAGQKLATSGEVTFNGPAPHVHFIYQHPGTGEMDGQQNGLANPEPVYTYLRTEGKNSGGFTNEVNEGEPEVGGAGESGISQGEAESISKGAAIAAFINLPGLLETEESLALKGERSLMNDEPLLGFIEQLCQGSLRNFMSLPNGDFFAFIPDYFGGLTGRTPYWEIDDIEILNGEIQLSDEALATHVYIVGDTGIMDHEIDLFEKLQTTGVITVFNAFLADFLNGIYAPTISEDGKPTSEATQKFIEEEERVPSLANKEKAIAFLERYGARPFYEEAPYIRSHYYETFLAYQMFCLMWSKQFLTTFEFTFMPELIPGGLVAFPQHGIQCYIDEVQHTGDYQSGFRTRANLSAPTATKNGNPNINAGMIRSDIFNPQAVHAERITAGKRGNKGQTGSKHALRE